MYNNNAFNASIFHAFDKMGLNISKEQAAIYYHFLTFRDNYEDVSDILEKKAGDLSIDEINTLLKIRNELDLRCAFENYLNDEAKSNETYKISTFIMRNPIEGLIRSKLTKDELREVDLIVDKYLSVSTEGVEEFINNSIDNYDSVKPTEVCAAYFLDDSFKVRALNEVNKLNRRRNKQ